MELTQGAIASYFQLGGYEEAIQNATLQVVSIKVVRKEGEDEDRVRVVLNDGLWFIQSILSSATAQFVHSNQLQVYNFIKVENFLARYINDKRVVVVAGLKVVSTSATDRIGSPKNIQDFEKLAEQNQHANVSGAQFYGGNPQAVEETKKSKQVIDETYGNIIAIEGISPFSHSWTIRARVSKKTPMRSWHNQKGEGRLFSVTLVDETGEIRATAFHSAEKFDQWFELLQEGAVYYISSPCSVKFANKKFSQANNDYELTFEKDTNIEKAKDQSNVPSLRYNFTAIGDLEKTDVGSVIDCLGILKEVGDVSEITSKTNGKPFTKRELSIVDNTLHQVRLTVWGDQAQNFDAPLESVVAFQSVKVSDFNGRSLSLLGSGSLTIDPDIEQAHKLKGWFDAQGKNQQFESHSDLKVGSGAAKSDNYKTIQDIKEETLGYSAEKPDYFTLKATVEFIKQSDDSTGRNPWYEACRTEKCNKKVTEHDGVWHCDKCDKDMDLPIRRYILSISVCDYTSSMWLTCFDDAGQTVMGKSADEIYNARNSNPIEASEIYDQALTKTWIFRCRAKLENFNEEQRPRISVLSATPVNYSAEAKRLKSLIDAYDSNDSNDSMFMR